MASRRYPRREPSLEEIKKTLPKSRQYKSKSLERIIKADSSRKSPTRGWLASSPQKGRERHEIYDKCGSTCFLRPQDEGFPVCPALRTTKGKCGVSCAGVQSAINRSRQYDYPDITAKAEKLKKQYNCAGRSPPRRSPARKGRNYDNRTKVELQDILRTRGLKVSGNKQELIDRLNE